MHLFFLHFTHLRRLKYEIKALSQQSRFKLSQLRVWRRDTGESVQGCKEHTHQPSDQPLLLHWLRHANPHLHGRAGTIPCRVDHAVGMPAEHSDAGSRTVTAHGAGVRADPSPLHVASMCVHAWYTWANYSDNGNTPFRSFFMGIFIIAAWKICNTRINEKSNVLLVSYTGSTKNLTALCVHNFNKKIQF